MAAVGFGASFGGAAAAAGEGEGEGEGEDEDEDEGVRIDAGFGAGARRAAGCTNRVCSAMLTRTIDGDAKNVRR